MQNPFREISQHRALSRLLIAQIPADFSDWLDYVAISALLAFSWQAGPQAFAFLAVALGLPYLLVGVFAGAIVDKSDLRTTLILSNLGRALTTLSLAFVDNIPMLLIIVFLRSSIDAFFSPAKQATIQFLAPRARLMQVNSLSHMINQASKIAGPAAGGLLLLLLAPHQVFYVNAAISLVAAIILFGLPHGLRPLVEKTKASVFSDIQEAFLLIRKDRILFFAILLMAGGFFTMFFYDTMFALLTAALLFDEAIFGLAIACVGAGGIIGAISLSAINPRRPFLVIGIGSLISGGCVATLGAFASFGALHVGVFLGIFALIGAATSAVFVPFKTLLQQQIDPAMIARITSLSEAANVSAMLVAPFIGAAIAVTFSVGVSFMTGGALGVLLGVVAIVISIKFAEHR